MSKTLELCDEFKKKYPATLSWFRVKAHAKLVDKSLHDNEKVIYAFAAQWDEHDGDWFDTAILALTNERIIVAQNRLIAGYRVLSITPRFFNDVSIGAGIIWGTVKIDTVKERIDFTCVSKKAVLEIKKTITTYMHEYRKKDSSFLDGKKKKTEEDFELEIEL